MAEKRQFVELDAAEFGRKVRALGSESIPAPRKYRATGAANWSGRRPNGGDVVVQIMEQRWLHRGVTVLRLFDEHTTSRAGDGRWECAGQPPHSMM